MSTINVVGQEIKPASDEHASLQKRFAFKVETRTAVQLSATRGREAPLRLEAADEDVIEFEYSNGLRQWTTAGELQARHAGQATSRGKDDPIMITAVPPESATRGAPDLILKGLKVLGIDPEGAIADKGVKAAIDYFEGKLTPGPGLYRLNRQGVFGDAVTGELTRRDDPYLLLLHGTFSSTIASFHHLLASREWADLWNAYDGRILARSDAAVMDRMLENLTA